MKNTFKLKSEYSPTGDQPQAIKALTEGVLSGCPAQTLLGVTGSGKTFTAANVIANVGKPTLVLSHNKTLAAQLYLEFKSFFPENAVEYYVSYYDYYQPEAYIANSDTYIEKDLAINAEIDKLRLAATSSLLSGRKDVIVVSSVSCIYGMGNPAAFYDNVIELKVGKNIAINSLLNKLIGCVYTRNDISPKKGEFRVKGDSVEIYLAYSDDKLRVTFWGNEIESIEEVNCETGYRIASFDEYKVYPANLFLTSKETQELAIRKIEQDLAEQVSFFLENGKELEAKRLAERVNYDIEMIRELGHCSGIENYSRYFDGREAGTRPYCLLDFFPEDFLVIIDESHVSVPQIRAMYGGDRSRKESLVQYGFRLPAALDNRPLTFDEFKSLVKQTIFISATPAEYELAESEGVVVEQLIRPTGLLDPLIIVKPNNYPVDDLMEEIQTCVQRDERTLVTVLSKRMAEELSDYLQKSGIRTAYIHSDVETLERVQIMDDLRKGVFQVLVGVNLLREGLDLPEVSLVAIFDADKQGFLRSLRSLTQTAGRAARNVNGRVIMYANQISPSMQQTIEETERRRMIQLQYNEEHGIVPRQIRKNVTASDIMPIKKDLMRTEYILDEAEDAKMVADNCIDYSSNESVGQKIERLRRKMKDAAEKLDFVTAAQIRDEMLLLEKSYSLS